MSNPSTIPLWLTLAESHIGAREVKGPLHSPFILSLWKKIKRGGIKDDETPWCAAFVGAMLEEAGIVSSRFESASSYLTWGKSLPYTARGAVVVFPHHVGFLWNLNQDGNLLILGGNQSDAVNIKTFPRSRAIDFRWPLPLPIPLPLTVGKAPPSAPPAESLR